MSHLFDNPGMMEAKIMMPYKTSTPLKPIFSKSDESSTFAETGVEDSGYMSSLADRSSASVRKSESSDTKDGCKNLSLFESMLQSRNPSIDLEQLVEKVNLRKEKKQEEMMYNVSTAGRPRSHSASEVCSVFPRPTRVRVSQDSSYSSGSSWSNVSSSPLISESGSPTLDQVLLMGCGDRDRRFPRLGLSPQLSRSSSDYDISDILAAIKTKEGPLQAPQTPSPDANSYVRNPESLFGLETLQRCLYQPRKEICKPGLASITEAESDQSLSRTPREYYSSGLSPGMTTMSLSPQLESPELVFECQSSVTWSGNIPQRHHQNPRYSAKIFLGGVPWDVTEMSLVQAFSQFGQIR